MELNKNSNNLHSRGHGLSLRELQFEYVRKNFIYRMLYETSINTVVGLRASCLVVFVCCCLITVFYRVVILVTIGFVYTVSKKQYT